MKKQKTLNKKISNIEKKKSNKKNFVFEKFHSYYENSIIFNFVLFLMTFILGIYLIFYSINTTQEKTFLVNENGNIDYSVCLNENEFYENKCLEKGKSYVASLINKVSINFDYKLTGDKDYLGQYLKCKVAANLVIKNKETSSIYYEKEYILKNLGITQINVDTYKINEEISINYDFYNQIANNFKSQYGVDTDSYLEVYFAVYNEFDEILNIPESSVASVTIPLSLKSIQIESNNISNSYKEDVIKSKISINNWVCLIIGVILTIYAIFKLLKIISLLHSLTKNKNHYDKILHKYLKEYDRLIVETRSLPEFNDYNILKISSFEELVDVRDNLRLPIMYYSVSEHQKAHFYILHEQNLYVYTLKEVDLMKDEKKKRK